MSTNYGLKALTGRGLVKANNFKTSANKRAYVYVLTPRGLEEKARISVRFLKRKLQEHDALKLEIERLKREMGIE
jgi:EPS-associated MarR family transcriptional regulator